MSEKLWLLFLLSFLFSLSLSSLFYFLVSFFRFFFFALLSVFFSFILFYPLIHVHDALILHCIYLHTLIRGYQILKPWERRKINSVDCILEFWAHSWIKHHGDDNSNDFNYEGWHYKSYIVHEWDSHVEILILKKHAQAEWHTHTLRQIHNPKHQHLLSDSTLRCDSDACVDLPEM